MMCLSLQRTRTSLHRISKSLQWSMCDCIYHLRELETSTNDVLAKDQFLSSQVLKWVLKWHCIIDVIRLETKANDLTDFLGEQWELPKKPGDDYFCFVSRIKISDSPCHLKTIIKLWKVHSTFKFNPAENYIGQCPGGEILPIRIKLVILRNNSVSLVECRVINSGSEIPCHKLASLSTKFRVINFMTWDSRHGIKILWKFSKKSLHRGFWGEKIKLSKNPCMGTLRGHIRRCSCKGDIFFKKLLPKTLAVRFLHNKIVLGILEIFFVLRIFFWK